MAKLLLLAALWTAVVSPLAAVVVVFTPIDRGSVADSGYYDPTSLNYATDSVESLSRSYQIYDLSTLPPGAIVTGAELVGHAGDTKGHLNTPGAEAFDLSTAHVLELLNATSPASNLALYTDLGTGTRYGFRQSVELLSPFAFVEDAALPSALADAAGGLFGLGISAFDGAFGRTSGSEPLAYFNLTVTFTPPEGGSTGGGPSASQQAAARAAATSAKAAQQQLLRQQQRR